MHSFLDGTKRIAEKQERRKCTQYPSAVRLPPHSAVPLLLLIRPAGARSKVLIVALLKIKVF
jgi:hypothetical protein